VRPTQATHTTPVRFGCLPSTIRLSMSRKEKKNSFK